MVGLVYSLWLRSTWSPEGLQSWSPRAPTPYPCFSSPSGSASLHEQLKWRDILWPLVPPVLYCVYALARARGTAGTLIGSSTRRRERPPKWR